MSLYGALFSGVSGLDAFSQSMGMIADNITNLNTIGYKSTVARFSTLVTQSSSASEYSPGGVTAGIQSKIDTEGLIQGSESPTDLAISGAGFFVVNTSSSPSQSEGAFSFTRAGSFTPDEDGFLANAAGLYLQGWPFDNNGNIPTNRSDLTELKPINVTDLTGTAQPTTTISLQANLKSSETPFAGTYDPTVSADNMASGNVIPAFERSIGVFDSQGGARSLTIGLVKSTTTNQWDAEIYIEPATDVTDIAPLVDGQVATGVVAFNVDGTLDLGATTLPSSLNINWGGTTGLGISSPQALTFNFGTDNATDGFTQFDSDSKLISAKTDGALFASLAGISVAEDGTIVAQFNNGVPKDIFKIPIATFANPNGLSARSGNAYQQTAESGIFNLEEAGVGSAGLVAPASLEASTVDLAEEFTTMITVQRAYSAASKIITTADDMLDELIRIKR